MRFVYLITTFLTLTTTAWPQDETPMKSALETNKKDWVVLELNAKDWRRISPQTKGKLAAKSPWTFDKDGINYTGGPAEILLFDAPKTPINGIFHVEWRYPKTAPAKGTSSGGIVFRTSKDGDVYHQALAGNKAGGVFVGVTLADGKPAKVPPSKQPGPTRIHDAGEWNTFEITFKDKTLSLFANGFVAADWSLCPVDRGFYGLKGDGVPIEFKNLQFKRVR